MVQLNIKIMKKIMIALLVAITLTSCMSSGYSSCAAYSMNTGATGGNCSR